MNLTEQRARQNLRTLIDDYHRLSDDDRRAMSEASVVRQFIDRLLSEVLGWDIRDPQRYKYELSTQAGRPDITMIPEKGGTIFLEAKRFGAIRELEQSRRSIAGIVTPGQMALTGMSVDRTPDEQQAINYAFANGGTWAILCNFERLRLFNARRDWLVLSFEKPIAYLDDFDLLWQLAYPNVVAGSLDALSNQRHTEEVDETYLAFINEWRERLAQDIVRHRAHNPWVLASDGGVNLPLLRAVVQRFLDRLVIIRFAEDHLVIPPSTLRSMYDLRRQTIYTFSLDQFLDQFFRKFDQHHNSALFALDTVDQARFSDDVLMPLVSKLYEARYRAMPADILGNTYEQFLGKTLALVGGEVSTRDNIETRKKQGSYYTPQVIVRHIVDHSLGRYLYGTVNGRPDGAPVAGETRRTSADIRDLRVLDSACGSGSFLIYAYAVLAEFYEREHARLESTAKDVIDALIARGVTSEIDLRIETAHLTAEMDRIQDYPRLILEHHLYGLDLDPQAAEIAVVNLMMRAMERRHRDKRLPLILNQNVKVGNGLIGVTWDDPRLLAQREGLTRLIALRAALIVVDHNAPEHDQIVRDLEMLTRQIDDALRPQLAPHFSDLEQVHPFHWGAEFPEVFFTTDGHPKAKPGFTIVFGNPPWEIVKPDLREFYAQFDERILSRYTRAEAETRIAQLDAEDPARRPAYETAAQITSQIAAYVRRGGAYTRQGGGDTATHKLFMERSFSLLADGGRLGYVVPSGIYTDLGTRPLREMLLAEGRIDYLYSFSNERFFFKGVDHRFKFCLIGVQKGVSGDRFRAVFRFNPRVAIAPNEFDAFVGDPRNLMDMRTDMLARFNPDSLGVMEFQDVADYQIVEKVYGAHPLLGGPDAPGWKVRLASELHMTSDRALFRSAGAGRIPLFEGKHIWHYDARYGAPEYWLDEDAARARLSRSPDGANAYQHARIAVRAVASSTNERTLVSTVLPPRAVCGNSLLVVRDGNGEQVPKLFLVAILNSLVMDYILRQKVTSNVNMFYLYSLPVPRLRAGDRLFDALTARAARLTCVHPEYAAVWQEAMGTPWEAGAGVTGDEARQGVRDAIDALVAHLYGLNRDEFSHILTTFALLFPDTPAGRSRREALLRAFDETRP